MANVVNMYIRGVYYPSSCLMLAKERNITVDGVYTIHYQGIKDYPFKVYCHDMKSPKPIEYLEGTTSGYVGHGLFCSKILLSSCFTLYKRVRIDPFTLHVDMSDRKFAETTCIGKERHSDFATIDFENCEYDEPYEHSIFDITGTSIVIDTSVSCEKYDLPVEKCDTVGNQKIVVKHKIGPTGTGKLFLKTSATQFSTKFSIKLKVLNVKEQMVDTSKDQDIREHNVIPKLPNFQFKTK